MTQWLKSIMVVTLLLMGAGGVWAGECPPGTTLKVIGSAQTGDASVSTTGHLVRASRVTCAGTACVAGMYDTDALIDIVDGASGNALVKDEPGAAASTSTWTEYDPPLSFSEGITFVDDDNVNAFLAYECR